MVLFFFFWLFVLILFNLFNFSKWCCFLLQVNLFLFVQRKRQENRWCICIVYLEQRYKLRSLFMVGISGDSVCILWGIVLRWQIYLRSVVVGVIVMLLFGGFILLSVNMLCFFVLFMNVQKVNICIFIWFFFYF